MPQPFDYVAQDGLDTTGTGVKAAASLTATGRTLIVRERTAVLTGGTAVWQVNIAGGGTVTIDNVMSRFHCFTILKPGDTLEFNVTVAGTSADTYLAYHEAV